MGTPMRIIHNLSTIPTFRPVNRPYQKPRSVISEPIAQSRNRSKEKPAPLTDVQLIEGYEGLSNNPAFFDAYIKERTPPEPVDKIYRCTKGFIWGESSKNNFYKMITCGREWCEDCGRKHSLTHDRRINLHLNKFLALNQNQVSIQYLVITIPRSLRVAYRSQEALKRFKVYWKEKLKREGRQLGLCRYHWAGEDGYLWKPHLNILTIGGFIPATTLAAWRAELGRWFKMEHKLDYTPAANIYTAYTEQEDKVRHWVSYVTRPTQTKYNKLNEDSIRNFRNTTLFKDKNFEIPEFLQEAKNEDPVYAAAAAGYDLLPDGTREKIVWRMKYDALKQRWRPDVVLIEHTRIDEFELIRRGFWREPKFIARPPT